MKTTIKMVAEYAGVSRGTVDRVIHNRGNVDPAVQKKVQAALRELDYSPNVLAQALAFNKTVTKLGFLMPAEQGFFRDELLRAIAEKRKECDNLGIEICVAEADAMNAQQYLVAIDRMVAEGINGLAICAQDSDRIISKIDELYDRGIPVVTVNSDIPESKRVCFVGEDAVKCGRTAAEIICKYLRDDESVLVIGGIPEFTGHIDRVRGFETYMKEKGLPHERYHVVYSCEKYEVGRNGIEKMLTAHPKIQSIYLAVESIHAVTDALTTVKRDKKPFIVCHDTANHTLAALQQGIVDFSIDQDMYAQGERPLQMLIDYVLYGKPIQAINDKIALNIISAECVS